MYQRKGWLKSVPNAAMAAQAAAHAAKEMIVVKKSLIVLVVLICLLGVAPQALADLLFGSKARLEQTMLPAVAPAISVRDPVSLYEVTYDLDGAGNRVVQDTEIPVEAGLVVVGFTAPSTGDRKVQEVRFRLDGEERAFDTIPGPRPGEDQERWLRSAIRTARNLYRQDERDVFSFKPFRTNTSPFMFVVDSALLACGPHSVDIYLLQDGGDGKGASAIIPFRVVQSVDGNGQPVLGEYQQKRLEASRTVAPPMLEDCGEFSFPVSAQVRGQGWEQYAIAAAHSFGYAIRPNELLNYAQYSWAGLGPAPFVFFAVDENGQLACPDSFELRVNTRRVRYEESPADGLLIVNDLPPNAEVTPYMDGRPVRAWARDLTINCNGYGHWVPAVRRGNQWTVDVK